MKPVAVNCRMDMSVPDYKGLLEQGQAAERSGYHTVFVRDHVSLRDDVASDLNLECWTSVTALACHTTRVRVGTQVICNNWRNPALLAKMAATLDVVSGGRLTMGMGAGFKESEFREYGFDFPSNADRVRALGETIQIMKLMWTEHAPTFSGRYYRIEGAINEPKPIQKGGPPVVVGASGEQISLRNVAKYADGWNAGAFTVEDFKRKREVLAGYCREAGRDVDDIDVHMGMRVVFDRDPVKAQKRRDDLVALMPNLFARRPPVFGNADAMLEYMRPMAQAGVRNFSTYFFEFDRHVENIQAFGEEVIPLLRQLD